MSDAATRNSRVPLVSGLAGGAVGGLVGFHPKLTRKQAIAASVLGGISGSLAGTVIGNKAIGSHKTFQTNKMNTLKLLEEKLDGVIHPEKQFARGDQVLKWASRTGRGAEAIADKPVLRAIQKQASAGDVQGIAGRPGMAGFLPAASTQRDVRGALAGAIRIGREAGRATTGKPFRAGGDWRPMLSGSGA